jgi:hypothetical protein
MEDDGYGIVYMGYFNVISSILSTSVMAVTVKLLSKLYTGFFNIEGGYFYLKQFLDSIEQFQDNLQIKQ